jgi:hypothetical protein
MAPRDKNPCSSRNGKIVNIKKFQRQIKERYGLPVDEGRTGN